MMKNMTPGANAGLTDKVRERAAAGHATLNARFRTWLEKHVRREQEGEGTMETIRELQAGIFPSGRRFSQEAVNER